ncbi:MAG: Rpn family recombination-promoting nuclease/putative transposase [Roseburia sp.]|nr:Rpn family recombination-promoting nuclease/putative transposase [Roseburia sp.]
MTGTLTGYENATGKIDYTLTNNYMFHVILQENKLALKGLISSLLHLPLKDIASVEIKNPIKPGAAIDMKEFILDLCITLNNHAELNLEMQVNNYYNWPDRSLSYLCRTFDGLCRGEDYRLTKPAIHIGILDFTLFPSEPEFYATFKLLNIKSHKVFNDKFILSVLSLKQIEQATDEDKEWGLDTWAKFFAAKTWKDIKMIAKNNEILTSASKSLYEYNSDWLVREQCRAREDFENHELTMHLKLEQATQKLTEAERALTKKNQLLAETEQVLAEKNHILAEKEQVLAEKEQTIAEKEQTIAEKEQTIAEKEQTIAEKEQTIAEKDALIQKLESLIKQQNNS